MEKYQRGTQKKEKGKNVGERLSGVVGKKKLFL